MSLLMDLPSVLAHPITIVANTSAALLALPGRLVRLVTSAEQTLAAAHAAVARTETLLDRVDGVAGRADGVVHTASRTTTAAAVAVEQAGTLTASAVPLLASYSKPLHRLKPTVRRLAETTEPHEIEALVTLIDRLPDLADAMEHDVLPLLSRLDQLGPDIHQLLDSVSQINRTVNRLPKVLRQALLR
jgi:methyl-accepting chemotaxis protein